MMPPPRTAIRPERERERGSRGVHWIVSALLVFLLAPPAAAEVYPPNVLLILVDDLGMEHLEFYNIGLEGSADTPKLSEWQKSWLQFYDTWSNPLCSPTRSTIQSGQYGFRTGVGKVISGDSVWGLDTSLAYLLPKVLEGHTEPYATAAFGKWHMGTAPGQGGDSAPIVAGYDKFVGVLLDKQQGQESPGGLPYFHFWRTIATIGGAQTDEITDSYLTREIADAFISWHATVQKPWFAYIAFPAPHEPFHCPPQGPGEPYPAGTFSCAADHSSDDIIDYRNMMTANDYEIGRILTAIGGDDSQDPPVNPTNTLIVFASDNGSPAAVTRDPFDPARAKCSVYDGGIRVPFLAGGNMVTPGEVGEFDDDEHPVGLVDLYATVLAVAGLAPPPGPTYDSIDISDYFITIPAPALRSSLYSEIFAPNFDPDSAAGEGPTLATETVRDLRYKLVYNETTTQQELFDLELDRFEDTDLLADGVSQEEQQILDDLYAIRLSILGQDLLDLCTKTPVGALCTSDDECCSKSCQPTASGSRCVNPSNICKQ